jgi:hypothetical protein
MPILIGETYIEWRHIFVLCLFVGIAICTKIHDNKYMVGIYYGIILNIVFSQPPCKQTLCNKVLLDDDGFGYVDNFLTPKQLSTYKKKFVKKYHSNTIFLGNPNTWGYQDEETAELVDYLHKKIQHRYKKKLYIDYAFLRVYNDEAINPFENFHLDSHHYGMNVTQIRTILNLHDQSNGMFSYKSKCCRRKTKTIKTKENTLILIQANKLLHKYKFKKGSRCVLVVDFVDSKWKGLYGTFWGTFDFVWDRIQKMITTVKNPS